MPLSLRFVASSHTAQPFLSLFLAAALAAVRSGSPGDAGWVVFKADTAPAEPPIAQTRQPPSAPSVKSVLPNISESTDSITREQNPSEAPV